MRDGGNKCPHGWPIVQRKRTELGAGWVSDFAPDCSLGCERGIGIAYKDGGKSISLPPSAKEPGKKYCPHGYPVLQHDLSKGIAPGWVQDYAPGCPNDCAQASSMPYRIFASPPLPPYDPKMPIKNKTAIIGAPKDDGEKRPAAESPEKRENDASSRGSSEGGRAIQAPFAEGSLAALVISSGSSGPPPEPPRDELGERFLELARKLAAPGAPDPRELLPRKGERDEGRLQRWVRRLEKRLENPCHACKGTASDPVLADPVKFCMVCRGSGQEPTDIKPGMKFVDRDQVVEVLGWARGGEPMLTVRGPDGFTYMQKAENLTPLDETQRGDLP